MERVIGGIDNAARKLNIYHLVFTDSSLYICEVMSHMEKSHIVRSEVLSDPMRFAPGIGSFENLNDMRNVQMDVLSRNLVQGAEIEKNLAGFVQSHQDLVTTYDLDTIDSVEFKPGTDFSLAHVIVNSGHSKLKFHLIHSNYEKAGKLDQETMDKYTGILQEALGDKLTLLK